MRVLRGLVDVRHWAVSARPNRIGVQRRWFQGPPEHDYPHYDVALSKRKLAVEFGAREVSGREMILIWRAALGEAQ